MAVVLVLMACLGNALALTLQRKAAQDSARQRGRSAGSFRDMVRRPPWLFGIVIFGGAVVCQVLALQLGSISLVQPVLVMELPFTLLVGWWILGGALRAYEWSAVALMSIGLVVLLATLRPHGGDALAAGNLRWILGTLVTLVALTVSVWIARTSRAVGKAAFFGIAAGIGSGFVAVIIKAMADALAVGGIPEVLATWQSYLLIPVGPVAFWTLQSGLRAGRLLASQPGLTLGNPILAFLWGTGLLGEEIAGGWWLLGGVIGTGLLTVGVFLLARSPVLAAQEGTPTASRTSKDPSGRRVV
ncbi:DMT family transporter [Actinomycetospora termitidis]|uniref:DMT family transporter n=1 Tax=Actinomycetospora termitidis TaxID=3053470 RepID=A0ABT7MK09_9PSEU|nr:DMT family transporter [Actinomycetospora sp. Odt1-22]MDL5160317.1 DMT family transporter [Actinomycetospora sp. Odt1-22]